MDASSIIIPGTNHAFLIIGDENEMVVTKNAGPKKTEPKKKETAKQEPKTGAKSAPKSKK